MIHPLSDCLNLKIDDSTNVWQYTIVLPGAIIGKNCNICSHCFVENDVSVGDNVTIKCGVYLWDGIVIENDVFVGPNVTFTNDMYPRSKKYQEKHLQTILKRGCSLGAGVVIIGGITVGENAMIGAGSVVTKDIPPNELWIGSPARFVRNITD